MIESLVDVCAIIDWIKIQVDAGTWECSEDIIDELDDIKKFCEGDK